MRETFVNLENALADSLDIVNNASNNDSLVGGGVGGAGALTRFIRLLAVKEALIILLIDQLDDIFSDDGPAETASED